MKKRTFVYLLCLLLSLCACMIACNKKPKDEPEPPPPTIEEVKGTYYHYTYDKRYGYYMNRQVVIQLDRDGKVTSYNDSKGTFTLSGEDNFINLKLNGTGAEEGQEVERQWVYRDDVIYIPESNFYFCKSGITPFKDYGNIKYAVGIDGYYTVLELAKKDDTSVTIPNKIGGVKFTHINKEVFADSKITEITFSEGLNYIDADAFKGCKKPINVYYKGNIASWCNIDFNGAESNPLSAGGNLYIDNNIVKNVTIPGNIEAVKPYVFYGCTIENVVFPNNVKSIGAYAFAECSALKSAAMGKGLNFIGERAFYNAGLTSISIAENFEIGRNAFTGCPLTDAEAPVAALPNLDKKSLKTLKITDGDSISNEALADCEVLESVTIGDTVKSIGSAAFYGCPKLKTVKMTDNVTYIGESAFSKCAVLSDINLSKGLTKIEYRAFSSSGLVELTIPEGVKEIDEYAFESCKALKTLKLPKTVTTLGMRAFAYTEKLETIEVDPANSVFHVVNNCLIEKSSKTLVVGCLGSEIPEDSNVVTTIGYGAFMGSSIKEIIIPGNIRKIETYAFGGCRSLERIFYKGDRFVFENAIGGAGTTFFASQANEDLIVEFETGDSYKPLAQ